MNPITESPQVTIITVVYDVTTIAQLDVNGKLVSRTNLGTNFEWIVGVNHKPATELEIRGECFSRIIECYDNNHVYFKRRTGGRGSLQHGMAINKLLRYVKTKYVLILDPDFYVFVDDYQTTLYQQP